MVIELTERLLIAFDHKGQQGWVDHRGGVLRGFVHNASEVCEKNRIYLMPATTIALYGSNGQKDVCFSILLGCVTLTADLST
jgi:hypothetical protein